LKQRESKIYIFRIRQNLLLRTVFDRYIIIRTTTHPHDRSTTLNNSKNLRNSAAYTNGAPKQKRDLLTKAATTNYIRSLRSHSPHDTLSRSHIHTPKKQQRAKRNSRRVQSTSPKHELPSTQTPLSPPQNDACDYETRVSRCGQARISHLADEQGRCPHPIPR